MLIPRTLKNHITDRLTTSNKVVVLYGARQVGKTTLVKNILKDTDWKILEVNADRKPFLEVLSSRNLELLKGFVSGYDVLFIDEAQRIPDIGINLKIMHDEIPALRIIVTGSSSLDLANRVKEPLTGRTWTYRLFPLHVGELHQHFGENAWQLRNRLDEWMRFGMYPEVLTLENYDDKRQFLDELTSSYLFKDILTLSDIRYPDKLRQLLKLLAFQAGNLVSIQELANTLQINRDTVLNYIDLLEKTFVVFRLSGFSRNLRKEVTSMDKIYFVDLGIRNAILENFNPPTYRQDTGALWENFLLVERLKKMEYQRLYASRYFWRTHTGAELDYVEEKDGLLYGFEFKWKSTRHKPPASWLENYPNASFNLVHQENFEGFVL